MSVFDRVVMAARQKNRVDPKAGREAAVAAGGIAENTKAWDALSTDEKMRRYQASGQGAVNASVQGAMGAAMPQFNDQLQSIRENAIRRGVSLGDTGNIQTRNEGSLASAFQNNLGNIANQNAMRMYDTSLERLHGYRDYATMLDAQKDARRSAGIGAVAGLVGTVAGGPLGASIGGKLGSMIGGQAGQAGKMASAGWNTGDLLRNANPGLDMKNIRRASGWR